jgi:hypothetical protein
LADATDVSVNYVGVLKDILKLDYGQGESQSSSSDVNG